MLRLYDFLFPGNGYKIRLALTQLHLPFLYHEVDLLQGSTREPWFLKKNPVGQIPVLELEDGTCLRESNAILCHLAADTPLFPAEILHRTEVLQWLFFEQSHIDQIIARARFRMTYPEMVPTRPEEFIDWQKTGERVLTVMDNHLKTRSFFVAERYTIADIGLYAYTHRAPEGGFELSEHKNVCAWLKRVQEQPDHITIDTIPRPFLS